MSKKITWIGLSLLMILSLVLSACQPQAPQPTEPAAATEPAAEEDTLIFGMLLSARTTRTVTPKPTTLAGSM